MRNVEYFLRDVLLILGMVFAGVSIRLTQGHFFTYGTVTKMVKVSV